MIAVLLILVRGYELLIVVRVLLSWTRADPRNPIMHWVVLLTEPVLAPVRRILPTGRSAFDFSPLVVILALGLLERIVVRMLL
ncbi:MAG: YggT family protein [Chitinispirillaceae bacterium]|nr:YggT family protein [Chitinispirillaceae bacterium]